MTTTEAQFQEFVNHCKKYINLLHLNDWDIVFEMGDTPEANAKCYFTGGSARKVVIRLRDEDLQDHRSLEYLALHECLEVLIGDICDYMSTFYSFSFVEDEAHRVIDRLIPVILPEKNV